MHKGNAITLQRDCQQDLTAAYGDEKQTNQKDERLFRTIVRSLCYGETDRNLGPVVCRKLYGPLQLLRQAPDELEA